MDLAVWLAGPILKAMKIEDSAFLGPARPSTKNSVKTGMIDFIILWAYLGFPNPIPIPPLILTGFATAIVRINIQQFSVLANKKTPI